MDFLQIFAVLGGLVGEGNSFSRLLKFHNFCLGPSFKQDGFLGKINHIYLILSTFILLEITDNNGGPMLKSSRCTLLQCFGRLVTQNHGWPSRTWRLEFRTRWKFLTFPGFCSTLVSHFWGPTPHQKNMNNTLRISDWTLQKRGVWLCFSQGSGISKPPSFEILRVATFLSKDSPFCKKIIDPSLFFLGMPSPHQQKL